MALQSYTRGLIAGMELAMRICRNRASDQWQLAKESRERGSEREQHLQELRNNEAQTCVGMIRLVQVEIGAGRMPLPEFTLEEQEEMNRIS